MGQSLNDIELNGIMMANLYGHSLVQISENPPPVSQKTETPREEIRFLGNNSKNITVLVNDPGNTFMPEGHLAFLTKILGACKLNIGDVAIVNTAHTPDFNGIISSLEPANIISFGTELKVKGIGHVAAPSINELVPETPEARAGKSKLWGELKKMFGV